MLNRILKEHLDRSLAIMVIDIEGKTNAQLKDEVTKRLNSSLKAEMERIGKEIGIEKDVYDELYESGRAKINKILIQYNKQIDKLVPEGTIGAKGKDQEQRDKKDSEIGI